MPIKRNFDSYFTQVKTTTSTGFEKKSYKVENLFQPVAKDGKYSIILRFLPSNPNEIKPFIENRSHMFQLPNQTWFGCDCLSKFGEPCPICDFNREQFKKYKDKEEAKSHSKGKWKPKYISNVLIVRNPNAPQTEGKVFRFEYSSLIMKLIQEAMTEREDSETLTKIPAINPFDWKLGANFVYEGVQNGKFMKNDTSHFGSQRPICKWDNESQTYIDLTDEEIDAIESQLYTLEDCEHKKEDCRTYEQILEQYEKKAGEPLFENRVSSTAAPSFTPPPVSVPKTSDSVDTGFEIDFEATKPVKQSAAPAVEEVEDTDSFFARLAEG